MKKIFQGIPLKCNLWEEFEFFELTINQRQKEDLTYAHMLNRIRIGNQNLDDIKSLKKHIIPDNHSHKIINAVKYYMNIMIDEPSTIALFSTVAAVNKFNELVGDHLGIHFI